MQDDILGWSLWNEKFHALDGLLSVAELHGLMMGILCVTEAPTGEQWRQILTLLKVPRLDDEAIDFLSEEAEDAAYALKESELDYLPILPDDEQALGERVQALADWCAGVVLGFGLAAQQLNDEEAEQIDVLQSVASVAFDVSDDDEEGEVAYEELYEHVRLIPVHLAMGRANKIAVDDSPLLKSRDAQVNDVVEVYHPQIPS
ncbi:MAG: UPF0149 family protein [Acinetobacter sp.]|nr:UPF0149 family protein [Acinetobacter sp.]